MPFILRILSYRNQPLATPLSRRFDVMGGTIGRTPDNDLVLEDPHKSISRKHAQIKCRDGNYFLLDLGSNPSLINGLALGSGKEAQLSQGDRITIGDYLIDVVLDAGTGQQAQSAATQPLQSQLRSPARSDSVPALDLLTDSASSDAVTMQNPGDPLGLDLFGGVLPDSRSPLFHGAESDHVSPELQAFPMASSSTRQAVVAIPDDYDLLSDYRPAAPVSAPASGQADRLNAESDVLQALLRGLGLPDLRTGRSAEEMAELVGAMLREAVEGTMHVLVARAMTKRESRIDMTVMASQANNPLKFFPDAQSALKQMLTNELAGYMTPVKAIGVAFDDIKAHELAVIAGMRAALTGVLQRFNPAEIEKQQEESVMDTMLAANRKAKMWDRLVELYGDVEREAEDDFQRLFGEKFSTAYEDQVNRLRYSQARPSGKK